MEYFQYSERMIETGEIAVERNIAKFVTDCFHDKTTVEDGVLSTCHG